MKKLCKQWWKRVTALFLVAALIFSCYPPVTVVAATSADEEDTSATDITAIARPATKGLILNYDQWANVSESLRLPTTVTVTLADGTTAEAAVTWDTTSLKYDTVGKYLLPGTVTLPEGATNGNNLKVYQVIKVEDFANILTNPSFETGSTSPWVKLSDSYATTTIVEAADAPDGTKVMKATYDGQMKGITLQRVTSVMNSSYGPGEYYLSADARFSEEQTSDASKVLFYVRYYHDGKLNDAAVSCHESNTYSKSKVYADSEPDAQTSKVTLTGDSWTTASRRVMVEDYDTVTLSYIEVYFSYSDDADAAVVGAYVDNIKFIPLNIELPYDASDDIVEMEDIATVNTYIPTKVIIQNYDTWVENVELSLGLPETVDVTTDKGNTMSVGVTWDTTSLQYDTVGEYNLTGTLQAAEANLTNNGGLTVTQTIIVQEYQNLLSNASFESGITDWTVISGPTRTQVSDPVKDGSYALKSEISANSDSYKFIAQDIKSALASSGSGEYYISVWARLDDGTTMDATDNFGANLTIRNNGDSDYTYIRTSWLSSTQPIPDSSTENAEKAPITNQSVLLDDEWKQAHRRIIVEFNDLNYAQFRAGTGTVANGNYVKVLYVDKAELVPLNVTIPNTNNIVSCESPAAIRVYEGTEFNALDLPESLEVSLLSGDTVSVGVTWSDAGYNAGQAGRYTLTGAFDLTGTVITNTQSVTPEITVVVREEGTSLRDTYYFSTSGDDSNDGLSAESPWSDVTRIPELLKEGSNVLLKRGDIWYVPELNLNLDGVKGTSESDRITLGAYGDASDAKPILAFMYLKPASEWTNEGNNIYSADISALTAKSTEGVYRVFVDGTVYSSSNLIFGQIDKGDVPTAIDDPANLEAEEFCVQGDKVYIKTNGEPFTNVELVPRGSYGYRVTGTDVSYLTIENLDMRGGSETWAFFRLLAPTYSVQILNTEFLYTHRYIMTWGVENVAAAHVKPVISGCTFDGVASEKEGADYRIIPNWQSIRMDNCVDGALIENNTIRNVGHAGVQLLVGSSLYDAEAASMSTGIKNCIIQNNLIEGANAGYARAFSLEGCTPSGSSSDLLHDNILRWNQCYGMTTSSHLFGENNAIYGNIFAYSDRRYTGWNSQPYGIDTVQWSLSNGARQVNKNNVILNNTFYMDVAGIVVYGNGDDITNNLYANNLFVNHENRTGTYKGGISVSWSGSTAGSVDILNNGFYTSRTTDATAIQYTGTDYTAESANTLLSVASGNISAAPGFKNVDESIAVKYEKYGDFSLSDSSDYRYAGIDVNDLDDELLEKFPILQKLDGNAAEEGVQIFDLNGNKFISDTPSIGAISYAKVLTGKVSTVAEPDARIVKVGTTFADLGLPNSVEVTLEDGSTALLTVTWEESDYDASAVGEYVINGVLSVGDHTSLDLNGNTASCTVTVKEKLEITELVAISGVYVANGTAAEDVGLPTTGRVVLENGEVVELTVIWSAPANYDAAIAGTYTFVGTLQMNEDTANTANLTYSATVTVREKLVKGGELLINPDFTENGTYDPWAVKWESGRGSAEVTTDPTLLKDGETSAIIVTPGSKFGSIQQDVTDQVKSMGDGKYLYEVWMRALNADEPITESQIALRVTTTSNYDYMSEKQYNIGTEWVQFREVFDIVDTANATSILYHPSTNKGSDDISRRFVIAGCSLIYLGANDTEAAVTLDKLDLTWDTIKGNNEAQDLVTSDLNLITTGGNGSAISWTSSDESVISANGTVNQGETAKTVTLIATITNGSYSDTVTFTVQVSKGSVADKGYDVSISTADVEADVSDIVNMAVKVESKEFENFASSELKLTYDPDVLEFNEEASSLNGATVKAENGILTLEDYGAVKDFGTAYTLAFTAKAAGSVEVTMTDAAFSTQEKAEKENLIPATISQATVAIKVTLRHDVELDEYFEGATKVEDGADYTFTAKDGNLYNYTVTATVDGQTVEVIQNADGSYTVENVTGKLVITGTRTGKTFDVTVDGTGKDDVTDTVDKATYGVNYTFTMPAADGYTYQLTILYADSSNVPYTNTDGVITILGTDIIGAFTIIVTKEVIPPTVATVIVDGDAAGDVTFETSAVPGTDYTFTVTKDSKYDYSVSAKVGETALELTENDGTYTIKGDTFKAGETITITVNKTLKMDNVTVTEYVTVDEAKIWLIRVNVDKLETEVYAYREQNMFWSEKYNAYCFLVVSSDEQPVVESGDLTVVTGTATDIDYGMDVNKSEKVDANDAQLVYNMYNAHYADFTESVTMEKFLRADVNFDAKINVEDAQAVVNYLLG